MSGVVTYWSFDLLSLGNATQLGPATGTSATVSASPTTAEKTQQVGVYEASNLSGLTKPNDSPPFVSAFGDSSTHRITCYGVQNWINNIGDSVTIYNTSVSAYNTTGTLTYYSPSAGRGSNYGQFQVYVSTLTTTSNARGGYALLNGGPTAYGELPLRNVSFAQRLNSTGSMSAQINFENGAYPPANIISATTPNKTMIVVDLDGEIIWTGIVRSRHFDSSSHTMDLNVKESWDYFTTRHQARDYTSYPDSANTPEYFFWGNTARDNYNCYIANAAVVGAAQNVNNSAFPTIQISDRLTQSLTTSNLFYPVYPITQRTSIDQIVGTYADAGYKVGYDFGFDAYWASGTGSVPLFVLNFDFPHRGSKTSNEKTTLGVLSTGVNAVWTGFQPIVGANIKNASGTTIGTVVSVNTFNQTLVSSASMTAGVTYTSEYDPTSTFSFTTNKAANNIVPRPVNDWVLDLQAALSYTWDEDGTQSASEVIGTPSSGSLDPVIVTDDAITAFGWPIQSFMSAFNNAINTPTLTGELQGDLASREYPIIAAAVTVPLDWSGVDISKVTNGDHVRVLSNPDNRFPDGLDYVMRIVGIDFNMNDEGLSTVTYSLNVPLTGLPAALPPGML